ncbi:MAG: type ISP restriction/modification enzyme, partial [Pseudanabaena sp.]
DLLIASANLGKELAKLLDIETKVEGVTLGTILPELRSIAAISKVGGGQLNPDQELALTAGWGHAGKEGVTMPGKGKIQKREYSADELKTLDQSMQTLLGKTTRDIYLNDVAYWKNMPVRVWDYTIGGYQVIKKWLSYREETLLGRSLKSEEVREVSNMARRIAAILLLETQLDTNYEVIKQATYDWQQFLR